MEINLKNKTAWVFGGSRGIGQAISIELANAGANVLLVARNKTSLYKTKDMLCIRQQQEHDVLSIDVSNGDALTRQLKDYRNLSRVDMVVLNSGGPDGGLAHTAEIDEYARAFEQHVLASQIISQIAIKEMKKKGFGRIINIISTSVKQPIAGLGVSNTIRGAVANWSKTLASELGQFGITVNNILPGATKTDRLASLVAKSASNANCSKEEIIKKMQISIPVGRFANPQELAYLAVFLCSDFAGYINGVNIPVDGGRTKSL